MQNQLNYYSRYNRIKVEDKKEIPSLYSLLSLQTLTKLAHDASVSLQMITLYKKDKLYHSVVGDHETDESEYLQANNLFTFRSFQSESVDRKKSRNRNKRQPVHVTKKKTKLNQKNQQQKLQKQAYLQSLVREVRSKSIERLQGNYSPRDVIKRQKKSKKKNLIPQRNKQQREKIHFTLPDQLNDLNQNFTDQQSKTKPFQIDEKKIHKKLIKSLVSDEDKSVKQSIHKSKIQGGSKQGRKQYVESIDDGNEKQLSGPSIVLERLNFNQTDILNLKLKPKQQKKQQFIQKKFESESKEDNPSSNDVKQSEIKSFSKQIEILKKPFKNLIQLQLNHSQSQIWQPEERSLQIPLRQFQVQEEKKDDKAQQKIQDKVLYDRGIEIIIDDWQLDQEYQYFKIKEDHQLIKIKSQIEPQEEIIDKVQFLSQINSQKQMQQPPYEHPLETTDHQHKLLHAQNDPPPAVKKSFKKFILNKELNARLVTSTILNQRNQRNLILSKQKPKIQVKENLNEKSQYQIQPVQQKSQKVNFKALIKKKKQTHKMQNLQIKVEKDIPLRKLQNQKLLQAFFNNN